MAWSDLNRQQKIRRLSLSLIITPAILLSLPLLGAIQDPRLLKEYWTFYALFFGVPFVVSLALWIISSRYE
jgi:hypothetical protein